MERTTDWCVWEEAYWTYIWLLWTTDTQKAFLFRRGLSYLLFMDGSWTKYCILYGILKSCEPLPWWFSGTVWRTSHIVSVLFGCSVGETMNCGSHPNEALFFMALCCLSEGWATLTHWMMDFTSMDLWIILAQRRNKQWKRQNHSDVILEDTDDLVLLFLFVLYFILLSVMVINFMWNFNPHTGQYWQYILCKQNVLLSLRSTKFYIYVYIYTLIKETKTE